MLAWVQQSSVQWLKTNLPLETEVKFILKYYCEIQHRVLVDCKLAVNCEFSLPADQLQAYTIILKKKKNVSIL